MLSVSLAAEAFTLVATLLLTLRPETAKLPCVNSGAPGWANTGAFDCTSMVPPMLSPPALTGVTPAIRRMRSTCCGSI